MSQLSLWHRALREVVGLSIETDDRALLRQQLYRVRTEADDDNLAGLVIIFPIQEGELWIVHSNAAERINATSLGRATEEGHD